MSLFRCPPALTLALLGVLFPSGCTQEPRALPPPREAPRPAQAAPLPPEEAPRFACFSPPRLAPVLPAEVLPILDQENVDCFAWQELIALGWVAAPSEPGVPDRSVPASRFGAPEGGRSMVFQTYKNVNDLFLPGARVPEPWSAQPTPPAACAVEPAIAAAVAAGAPVLEDIQEAGVSAPAWLTAQNGKNVYFEVRVNRDIFEYVRREGLYDAQRQRLFVLPGGPGIALPAGATTYGQDGAIEIKAAWLEIDDPSLATRFVTTDAALHDPASGRCRLARMGLVGLHIAHKTPSAQQWTWATFEHEDNAPERAEVERGALAPRYTFYRPGCTPAEGPACQPNRKPTCVNGACDPPSRPTPVVREVSIPPEAVRLNEAMARTIAAASPDSAWLHYRLVDVMWPGSAERVAAGREAPLTHGGAQPTAIANTTMETYAQTGQAKRHCLDCHAHATIAPTTATITPSWASDYSFIFHRACDSFAPRGACHPGYDGGAPPALGTASR